MVCGLILRIGLLKFLIWLLLLLVVMFDVVLGNFLFVDGLIIFMGFF